MCFGRWTYRPSKEVVIMSEVKKDKKAGKKKVEKPVVVPQIRRKKRRWRG
jgi:hypothetical protein